MEVVNLFPTAVGIFKYDKKLDTRVVKELLNTERKKNQGNFSSKEREILKSKELADLKVFIDNCLSEYFKSIVSPSKEVSLRITQSWLNFTSENEYHHRHSHANSFLSGCFYINANKETDKIYFFKNEVKQIEIATENYNVYNSSSWWLPVSTNDLIIFPSTLTHEVAMVATKEERVSLAFNTFPVGYIGDDDTLTGLHL